MRDTLRPELINQSGVVDICIERPHIDALKGPGHGVDIDNQNQNARHNDSYIMATQYGIKTFSLDPAKVINRSQSLQERTKRFNNDSVIYKGITVCLRLLYRFSRVVVSSTFCHL